MGDEVRDSIPEIEEGIFGKIHTRLLNLEKRKLEVKKQTAGLRNFFVFTLGEYRFALEFKHVFGLMRKYFSSQLLNMPDQLAGIFTYQGKITSMFYMDKLLNLPPSSRSVLAVVGDNKLKIGLLIGNTITITSVEGNLPVEELPKGEDAPGFSKDIIRFEDGPAFQLDIDSILKSPLIWI